MTADAQLTGPRVVIRPFRLDDVPAVLRYASDPEVSRYLPWEPYSDPETAEAFVASTLRGADRWYARAIELRATGDVVGGVDLRIDPRDRRTAEIGYALARTFWGRGYAHEAADLMLTFAFTELQIETIHALCVRENTRSIHILERLGLIPDPTPTFPSWGIRTEPNHQKWTLTKTMWGPG